MPVESAADRAVFVDADDFGVTVTYTSAGAYPQTTITGILDNSFREAGSGDGVAVQTAIPAFLARTDDIPGGGFEDDGIAITSEALTAAAMPTTYAGTYYVKVIEPDGTGMTTLWLEKWADG